MTTKLYPPIDDRYVSLLWAEPDAAREIAGMHAELFTPAWDEQSVRGLLVDPCSNALVARVRLRETGPTVPAGFAIGRAVADEAEILTIGVSALFQRRGIGRRLLVGLSRALKSAGAERLFLEVAADNVAACGLYSSLDFKEVGRRAGYYERPEGACADALTLSRNL
jgi:[ribosomal protein S18]-alanine N-acetyltransferase